MQKDIIYEGMSPNYREPYSYKQNNTETFDDMEKPSSALETRKGFDLQKAYDRARAGWPAMKTAPIAEDIGGNAANVSTGASIGNNTPEHALPANALSLRTAGSRGLGDAERGAIGNSNPWDSAYTTLSEVSKELQELILLLS